MTSFGCEEFDGAPGPEPTFVPPGAQAKKSRGAKFIVLLILVWYS
jgi:hypothetical protein